MTNLLFYKTYYLESFKLEENKKKVKKRNLEPALTACKFVVRWLLHYDYHTQLALE